MASVTMAALFELEDVDVEVDGRSIIDVPNLVIPDSGITVVAGPAGSGKSTLLRPCNRPEVPTRGVIRIRGDDLASLTPLPHPPRVGMDVRRTAPARGPGRATPDRQRH